MVNPTGTYEDTDIEAVLLERITSMSLEQKVRLLTGASAWSLHDDPSIGLRTIIVSDGPTGVRGQALDDRETSASLPSATAIAASWDLDLVQRLGHLIAAEARDKNVDVVLGPTINLHRSPRGGRHFEAYSEDPWLTGKIGAAYVRAVQSCGIGSTAKHYVANDSETDRMTVDARVDERTLREVYLAPFEELVAEGTWLVMSAYNGVNGHTMSASPLLTSPLKDEWGFDGAVMSDWAAVHEAVRSGAAGLDIVMPGPDGPWGAALVEAVRAGQVPESAIDDKVHRLLRLAARVGALEGVTIDTGAPAEWTDADVAALLREAAADGMVLVRNNGILPLSVENTSRVAVLGQHAHRARSQGGGSATVFPRYVHTPLEGLHAAFGDSAVTYAPGLPPVDELIGFERGTLVDPVTGDAGMRVQYLDAEGTEFATEIAPSGRVGWLGDPRLADASLVRLHTRYTARETGHHRIGFSGLGMLQFRIDGELVSADPVLPESDNMIVESLQPPRRVFDVTLEEGQTIELQLELTPYFPTGLAFAVLTLGYEQVFGDPDDEFARAVEAARSADIAVVVVGTTEAIESEGHDRPNLALPDGQDELVRRVAAANPRTVVIVNSGAPVIMPWIDEVAATVVSWFPGAEFGTALADVLTGEREPGGRMPTTWPAHDEDVPVWTVEPTDGKLVYGEGVHIGYRAWAQREAQGGPAPAVPFGFGLGYTEWSVGEPTVTGLDHHGGVVVRTDITNVGRRPGKHVLQAYVSRVDPSDIDYPAIWLAGFHAAHADPGQAVEAVIEIAERSFAHWSVENHRWEVEPGSYAVRLGTSAADLGPATLVTMRSNG